MKKLFVAGLVGVMALLSGAAMADMKIAVIDMQEVISKSPQRDAIAEKLRKEFQDRADALKKGDADIRTMGDKAQKDLPTMTEQQKLDVQRKMDSMGAELQRKQKEFKEDYQRRGSEEQRQLIERIAQIAKGVAAKDGYQMVVLRDAVLYVQPQMDITDQVVAAVGSPATK